MQGVIKHMGTFFVRAITGIVFAAFVLAVFFLLPPWCFSALLLLVAAEIVLFEWSAIVVINKSFFVPFTLLYPILPFALMIALNQRVEFRFLLIVAIFLAFAFDTGAYIFGVLFGRNRLVPLISYGKTWEGLLGGCFCACVTSTLIIKYISGFWNVFDGLLLGFLFAAFLLAGDLFESTLKRLAGLKDSGFILPGHGGLLDRFDSILFAAYFIFFFRDQLIVIIRQSYFL
jgi:phosphatidate cytidylyltransferase